MLCSRLRVLTFSAPPVSFLLILYVKSTSEGNQSGGFDQEYYDASYKRGDKKAKVRSTESVQPLLAALCSDQGLTRPPAPRSKRASGQEGEAARALPW